MNNREQPNPIDPEDFDDSPYAERKKLVKSAQKSLEDQRLKRVPEDEKQARVTKTAREFLKKLNKKPKPDDFELT